MNNSPRLFALFAALTMSQYSWAEISGSGFHQIGCDAQIEATYFQDINRNGIYDASDLPLGGTDSSITIITAPQLGTDTLTADALGRVLFFNLCPETYAFDTQLLTIPVGLQLNSVTDDVAGYEVWDGNPTSNRLIVPFNAENSITHSLYLGFVEANCSLGLTASCFVAADSFVPSTPDYECKKPVEELTMIWTGVENIRVVAHQGKLDKPVIANIDNVAPGTEVRISGFADSGSDVIWELFYAGTDNKIGESAFHLSCSDHDMDEPSDCGKLAGDGKSNDKCSGGDGACLNNWVFEGWVDAEGEINCTNDYPTTPLLNSELSCLSRGPNEINFQYALVNNSAHAIDISAVNDSVLGPLAGVTTQTLESGGAYTFAYSDYINDSEIRQLSVNSYDHATEQSCVTATNVEITIDPPPSPCESVEVELKDLGHDKVNLKLYNNSEVDLTLQAVEISWPAENQGLKELKTDDGNLIDGAIAWTDTAIRIDQSQFARGPEDRSVLKDKDQKFEFKFDEHVHDSPQAYEIRLEFGDDCEVNFSL